MASNQFYLKWNNYHESLISSFEQLLSEETMVDVTLSCEGKTLKAHKIILSASSPLFQNLLKENPSQHPIIIMQETKYPDLKSIIDFIYKGQVCVYQNQLSTLLKTAEALKIRGLVNIENNDSAASNTAINNTLGNVSSRNSSRRKRKRKKSSSDFDSSEELPSKIRESETANLVIKNTSSLANTSNYSKTNVSQSKLKNELISIEVDSDADCSIVEEIEVKKEEKKAKFISSTPIKSQFSTIKVKETPPINRSVDRKSKSPETKPPENVGVSSVNQNEVNERQTGSIDAFQSSIKCTSSEGIAENELQISKLASPSNSSEKSETNRLTVIKDINQLTLTPSSRSSAITDNDPEDPPTLTPERLTDAGTKSASCDENSAISDMPSLSEPSTSQADKDSIDSTNPDASQGEKSFL